MGDSSPVFVTDVLFEGTRSDKVDLSKGTYFTLLLRKGNKSYEFMTNYVENYPIKAKTRTNEEARRAMDKLESIISSYTDKSFKVDLLAEDLLELQIDKHEFESIKDDLPQGIGEKFQKKYKTKAMWEIGRHRVVELEPWLEEILEQNRVVNQNIFNLRWLLRDFYKDDMKQEYDLWKNQVLEGLKEENYNPIRKNFNKILQDNNIRKEIRIPLWKQLHEILHGREDLKKTDINWKHYHYTLSNLFVQAVHFTYEKSIRTEMKNLLSNRENKEYSETIQESSRSINSQLSELESKVKSAGENNRVYIDDELNSRVYLDVMSRDERKNLKLQGLEFKVEDGEKKRLEVEDYLKLPIAFFDIEKFLFGSIFEIISHCGLRIDTGDSQIKLIDTVRKSPQKEIEGYTVRTEDWEHEAIMNTARTLTQTNPFTFVLFNANYDLFQYKQTQQFFLGYAKKLPKKEATVEVDEEGKDFMGRFGFRGQEVMDLYKFANISMPHLQQRRLGHVINHIFRKSGLNKKWEKSIDYDEGRENDLLAIMADSKDANIISKAEAASLENHRYTEQDVEMMAEALYSSYGRELTRSMLDIRNTFNISLTQITSLATTVRNYKEQVYYETHGKFLDEGFFREIQRKKVETFKNRYTTLKKKTLFKKGLQMFEDINPQIELEQYYYSPEMDLAVKMVPLYPEIRNLIGDVKKMKDAEIQTGILQYVRNFFIPLLAEYTDLRKHKEEIIIDLKENKHVNNPIHEFNNQLYMLGKRLNNNPEARMDEFDRKLRDLFMTVNNRKISSDGSNTKWIWKRMINFRNKSMIFEDTWGARPLDIENYIEDNFGEISRVLNESEAHAVHLSGKFVFTKNTIPEENASNAGLFRLQGVEAYRYGKRKKEITYYSQGKYTGYPSRKMPTPHFSLFEIELLNPMLDKIFEKNYRSVFESIATNSRKIRNLDQQDNDFKENLLNWIRKRNVYVENYVEEDNIKKHEFTEDAKHKFNPDKLYYKTIFFGDVFGYYDFNNISPELADKKNINHMVSLDSRVSGLISGFYPLTQEAMPESIKEKQKDVYNENQVLLFESQPTNGYIKSRPTDLYVRLLNSENDKEADQIIGQMMEFVK